jgi:hypothetical protein
MTHRENWFPSSCLAKDESFKRRLDGAKFAGIARALGADHFKMVRAVQ